jgi:ABC-type phosphate/phosphonate transport system substrate-binding protein
MCGWPFANSYPAVQALAAPRPAPAWAAGGPTYRTDLVVPADRPFRALSDTFGGRIGWMAEHSQSGYLAVVEHLSGLDVKGGASPFGTWVGPLVTPRGVVDAIVAGQIDVGPLDSYWRELLSAHEPDTSQCLRVVASTRSRPMPLLVASAAIERPVAERLRQALVGAASDTVAGPILDTLCLAGFAPVARSDYEVLVGPAPVKRGELSVVR